VIDLVDDDAGESKPVIESTSTPQGAQWTISPPSAWDTSGFAGLRAILREDRETTPAIVQEGPGSKIEVWLAPGSLALAVHRFGEWIKSDGPPHLLRRPAALLHTLLAGYVRTILGFEIARSVRLGRRVKFYHQNGVVIGGQCVIGDDCVIRHGVTIAPSPNNPSNAPQIGSRVSFGVGCVVLGGVRIGDGATIGPNAVVTTDVPPGATVLAQPARVLRLR
jgi:serine O-acetyltransferase